MLECFFYLWVTMEVFTRWWTHRCLKCQARNTSSKMVRWPILSLPLPKDFGMCVSVDLIRPLAVTRRENPDESQARVRPPATMSPP